jgi:hypothetical protein
MPALLDRRYLSRYASDTVGFVLHRLGVPADADANVVTAQLVNEEDFSIVFTRSATHLETGKYGVVLTGEDTSVEGLFTLNFAYTVDSLPDRYADYLEVGPPAPAYDALSLGYRDVVEHVWIRFADLFDSPLGGPHLQTYAQSHFGRNRLAQLLRIAIGRLNTISQPRTTYSLDGDFPFESWGPLLEQALYVEVLKHLMRSYVEQPDVALAASISRLDRQSYMDRWAQMVQLETADLERQMSTFRMENLGLGSVHALVSGGAYGRYGPLTLGGAGQAAARGYFPARVIGW